MRWTLIDAVVLAATALVIALLVAADTPPPAAPPERPRTPPSRRGGAAARSRSPMYPLMSVPMVDVPSDLAVDALALNPLDATSLLAAFGTLGVFVVLFAETGLLIGFFLPGDSLLFSAGLFCTTSATAAVHLSLPWVLVAAVAGALGGAQVGFLIGRRAGPALTSRTRPKLAAAMARSEQLFARYGHGKAIVLARFVPVVRTVLNPLAGALDIPTATFTRWQIIGGLAWTVGLTLGGYALGSAIPNVDAYLLPIVAVIIVVSLLPMGLELLRHRRGRRHR